MSSSIRNLTVSENKPKSGVELCKMLHETNLSNIYSNVTITYVFIHICQPVVKLKNPFQHKIE